MTASDDIPEGAGTPKQPASQDRFGPDRLDKIQHYAHAKSCRHRFLLDYFGDDAYICLTPGDSPEDWGCLRPPQIPLPIRGQQQPRLNQRVDGLAHARQIGRVAGVALADRGS